MQPKGGGAFPKERMGSQHLQVAKPWAICQILGVIWLNKTSVVPASVIGKI